MKTKTGNIGGNGKFERVLLNEVCRERIDCYQGELDNMWQLVQERLADIMDKNNLWIAKLVRERSIDLCIWIKEEIDEKFNRIVERMKEERNLVELVSVTEKALETGSISKNIEERLTQMWDEKVSDIEKYHNGELELPDSARTKSNNESYLLFSNKYKQLQLDNIWVPRRVEQLLKLNISSIYCELRDTDDAIKENEVKKKIVELLEVNKIRLETGEYSNCAKQLIYEIKESKIVDKWLDDIAKKEA